MFIENKYYKWYYNIINAANVRELCDGYYETHHIVPVSLGGCNSSDNLVKLTAKEHFVCHLLLTKFTTGNHQHKMLYAASGMTRQRPYQHRYVNAATYQRIKTQAASAMSKSRKGKTYEELYGVKKASKMREKQSQPRGPQSKTTIEKRASKLRGKKRTTEQRETMSAAQVKRDYVQSQESKDRGALNISKALKGREVSEEWRDKISNSLTGKMLGVPKSEETKQKMRKPKSEAHKKAISEARKAKYAKIRAEKDQ